MGLKFGSEHAAVVVILAKPEVGLESVAFLANVGQIFTLSVALLGVRGSQSKVFDPVVASVPVYVVDRHAIGNISMMKLPNETVAEVKLLVYAHLPILSPRQRARYGPWRAFSVLGGIRPYQA